MRNNGIDLNSYSKDSNVFVKNLTTTDVNLHVNDAHGRVFIITIPRTFIPLDLTEWANVQQLKESEELRSALRGGVLQLIAEKDAKDIIDTEEGRIEHERVMSKLNLVTEDLLASNQDLLASSLDSVAMDSIDDVNDQIRNAMSDKEISNKEKMAIVIALDKERPLPKADLEFILSVADESQQELIKFAKNRLKDMSGILNK